MVQAIRDQWAIVLAVVVLVTVLVRLWLAREADGDTTCQQPRRQTKPRAGRRAA